MPFLLAKILNFQGSTHPIGVGSFSKITIHIRNHHKLIYDIGIRFMGSCPSFKVIQDTVAMRRGISN